MGNFAVQRKNMVEGQVRTSDVTDRRVLRAMDELPREIFAPEDMRPLAYFDQDLRVSAGMASARYLLAPSLFAKMVQALDLDQGQVVLDVGCATGYGSAVMARMVQTVVGLEVDPDLAETASRTLSGLSVDNVVVVTGPLNAGWGGEGPYDAIMLNGAVPEVPQGLLSQLKAGGRLVAVVAQESVGCVTLFTRSGSHFSSRTLFDATAPSLPGFAVKPHFVF